MQAAVTAKRWSRQRKYLKPLSRNKVLELGEEQLRKQACVSYIRECVSLFVFLVLACVLASSCTTRKAFQINQSLKTSFSDLPSGFRHESVHSWLGRYHSLLLDKFIWNLDSYLSYSGAGSEFQGEHGRHIHAVMIDRPIVSLRLSSSSKICFEQRPGSEQQISGLLGRHSVAKTRKNFTGNTTCLHVCSSKQFDEAVIVLNSSETEARKQIKHVSSRTCPLGCIAEFRFKALVQTVSMDTFSIITVRVTSSRGKHAEVNLDVRTFDGFWNFYTYVKLCKVMFLCCLLYLLYLNVFAVLKERTKYFMSFWNWIEILVLILGCTCVALYFRWSITLYAFTREMERESHFLLEAGKKLHQSQELVRDAYSILVFLLMMKLIHLLRIWRLFSNFVSTLDFVCKTAKFMMIPLLLSVFAFVHSGCLLFGHVSAGFSSVIGAFLLVWNLFRIPGEGNFMALAFQQNFVYTIVYIVMYLLGCVIFLQMLFASAFMWLLKEVKRSRYNAFHYVHLAEDLWSMLSRLMHVQKKKTDDVFDDYFYDDESDEEDEEDIIPVEYAMSEVQCQLDELSFRVKQLIGDKDLPLPYDNIDGISILRGSDDEDVEYLYRSPVYFPDLHPDDLIVRKWIEMGQEFTSRRHSGHCSVLSSTGYREKLIEESHSETVSEWDKGRYFTVMDNEMLPRTTVMGSSSNGSFTSLDVYLPELQRSCSPRTIYGHLLRYKQESLHLPEVATDSSTTLQSSACASLGTLEPKQVQTEHRLSAPNHSIGNPPKITKGKPKSRKPGFLTHRTAVFPDDSQTPTHLSSVLNQNKMVCPEPDTSQTTGMSEEESPYCSDCSASSNFSSLSSLIMDEQQPTRDIRSLIENTSLATPIISPLKMQSAEKQ